MRTATVPNARTASPASHGDRRRTRRVLCHPRAPHRRRARRHSRQPDPTIRNGTVAAPPRPATGVCRHPTANGAPGTAHRRPRRARSHRPVHPRARHPAGRPRTRARARSHRGVGGPPTRRVTARRPRARPARRKHQDNKHPVHKHRDSSRRAGRHRPRTAPAVTARPHLRRSTGRPRTARRPSHPTTGRPMCPRVHRPVDGRHRTNSSRATRAESHHVVVGLPRRRGAVRCARGRVAHPRIDRVNQPPTASPRARRSTRRRTSPPGPWHPWTGRCRAAPRDVRHRHRRRASSTRRSTSHRVRHAGRG